MKNKIILGVIVLSAALFFLSQKKESEYVKTVKKGVEVSVQKENEIQALALKENVPSVEELEKELLDKSTDEIRLEIEKNNQFAKERNFFARANAQILPASEMAEFIKTIRMNSVLHNILLEIQFDEMESEAN